MIRVAHELEVFQAVIEPVAVDVMDGLVGTKGTAKTNFYQDTVFLSQLAVHTYLAVAPTTRLTASTVGSA